MKTRCSRDATAAFTLIEILVVLAIIVIVLFMLLPRFGPRGGPYPRVECLSNLRQIQIGFIMWQTDHHDAFPWQVSTTNGGTMELDDEGNVFPHFRALAEHRLSPRQFVCPSDKSKTTAGSVTNVANENISYFLNLDAGTNTPAAIILVGDRNLQIDGRPANAGLFNATTNHYLSWTRDLHRVGGNLGFADGHAEWCRTNGLNNKFREQRVAASRLVIP
jgi:prepilin-type N-terminal cleavage/methylation domain-containing protein/prepilin-type processing-associated H-X9-DG protein